VACTLNIMIANYPARSINYDHSNICSKGIIYILTKTGLLRQEAGFATIKACY